MFLKITRKDQVLIDRKILTKAPDRISFIPELKDFKIVDNTMHVFNTLDQVIYTEQIPL